VPKIPWQSLPLYLKQHLVEGLREQEITQDDLEALLMSLDQLRS
jgi:hypothetical protein